MKTSTLGWATLGLCVLASSAFAQQPAPARGGGRGGPEPVPPAVMFREEWKFPPYSGALTDENRRVTPEAVTNPRLQLGLYGADSRNVLVYEHEQRHDLWMGLVSAPVAITLKDKANYMDLTGLARFRAIVRTQPLHTLYPVVKLADGTLLAGTRGINTGGDFVMVDFAFNGQRWFKLDPMRVVTGQEVQNPDLTKVDEVGVADLAPGGGHGNSGNLSTVEVLAKPVARNAAGSR